MIVVFYLWFILNSYIGSSLCWITTHPNSFDFLITLSIYYWFWPSPAFFSNQTYSALTSCNRSLLLLSGPTHLHLSISLLVFLTCGCHRYSDIFVNKRRLLIFFIVFYTQRKVSQLICSRFFTNHKNCYEFRTFSYKVCNIIETNVIVIERVVSCNWFLLLLQILHEKLQNL